jgi:hypothetical protein
MADKPMTKEEIESAIKDTLKTVDEMLKKSEAAPMAKEYPMAKDGKPEDKVEDQVPPAGEPGPDAAADAAGDHAEPDADNMPPPDGAMPPDGQMPAEGGEGDEIAAHIQDMNDDELDMILDMLMAEKEKRSGAEAPAGEPAPEAAPPAPGPEMAEKSMKSEFADLAKSVQMVAHAVSSLKGEMETMKKSASAAADRARRPVSRPAASNDVQVLHKSQPVQERLSKSETLRFLEVEQRKGNKTVNTDMIAGVNACRDEQELRQAQDEIKKLGITLPMVEKE